MGSRLQDAHARVLELTSEEVERRIARTLLRLAQQAGRNVEQGIEIGIPLRRQDVAQLTGTTLHSVSRVLSRWEQTGLVETDHQRIVLRDLGALSAVVGSSPMPRTEVTKKLWAYIKRNGLQDAKERRMINADDKLRAVFGGKGKVSMFEMTKLVSRHMK